MHIYPRPPASKVKELLAACNLPASDLEAADFEHFFGCGVEAEPKGVVGVELYGEVGLLRSLAVEEAARGHGCGTRLVKEAEKHAVANGVEALYLLTTTAEEFFRSQGYMKIERASVPEAIRRTSEFSTLCPSTATAMVKVLKA
ncbi:MAG: GNAT family N-acetyltransferase [Betaproteobacteria bacterium]|nr:MAG: GNAT family N-acetyltransferase [Betaproteobacteria bacterium]